MGHNGKPHFFAGPDDDEPRCRAIVARLLDVCGEGNFHYTVPLDPAMGEAMFADLDVRRNRRLGRLRRGRCIERLR